MVLDKKLVLEELEEAPILNDEEKQNFNTSIVSELLNNFLSIFNSIQSYLADPNLDDIVKNLLDDISDDTALCVGKLQEIIKAATDEDKKEIIAQGQEEAQAIIQED